jgi:hypothetical protein
MLRGCVGLNISLYFFMILTRALDLIKLSVTGSNVQPQQDPMYSDLVHIRHALQQIYNDPTVHLTERLAATLHSGVSSDQAILVGMKCVQLITLTVNP